MIISHKHKYLFIEIPLTASWAIHHELVMKYDGQPILHKHATFSEFRRHATHEELGYFVFATVRNPLDKIVSTYFKLKNDQKGVFSNAESLYLGTADYSDLNKFEHINKTGIDFINYFRTYYKLPYGDMIDLSDKHLNYAIRYETIQEGFANVLRTLGLEQVQPLPRSNETPGKSMGFLSHYTTEIIPQAKRICGPFMRKWNYDFPEGWGDHRTPMADQLKYDILNRIRFLYTVYLRYNNASYAKFFRKLRARLLP